jgi:hypothetical protein
MNHCHHHRRRGLRSPAGGRRGQQAGLRRHHRPGGRLLLRRHPAHPEDLRRRRHPLRDRASNSTKLIGANMGNAVMINSTGYDQVKSAVGLFKAQGIKKLAIVHQGDGYSEDLAKLTKEAWDKIGEVVSYEVVNKGEQDSAPW